MVHESLQQRLLHAAIVLGAVKLLATVWLVRQPDATTVTHRPFGRIVCAASKATPALFVAVMLARARTMDAPPLYLGFLTVAPVAAMIVLAFVVVRKRAAGRK